VFADKKHLAIALVPETELELVRRLKDAGRGVRIDQALQDLIAIQEEIASGSGTVHPIVPVVNMRDRVEHAAKQIVAIVEGVSR
jgi:hypothetical protein